MKQINLAYLYHFRKRYRFWGHFWQGRFKSLLIEKDSYLISCGRYIETNPVRAKIVKAPADYPYSSCKFYAYGKRDDLIDEDPLYQQLAKTVKERQSRYRDSLKTETQLNLNLRFLGSRSFIDKMEQEFGVSNLKNRRGRPVKANK